MHASVPVDRRDSAIEDVEVPPEGLHHVHQQGTGPGLEHSLGIGIMPGEEGVQRIQAWKEGGKEGGREGGREGR